MLGHLLLLHIRSPLLPAPGGGVDLRQAHLPLPVDLFLLVDVLAVRVAALPATCACVLVAVDTLGGAGAAGGRG